jgi:choice-of-anchor C domain-containing protein
MEHRSGLTRVLGLSRRLAVVGAVAVCLFAASPAHANLVTNGSFEGGVPSTFVTLAAVDSSIPGWTVTGGTIDWINTYWVPSDGSFSLDMEGLSRGTIETSAPLTTVIGQTYRLSFDMAGNPDGNHGFPDFVPIVKELDVTVGGVGAPPFFFDTTGHSLGSMGWVTQTFYFTATSTSTSLSFAAGPDASDTPFFGAALDNVSVEAVPEPGTLMLLGAGLSALGLVKRRKA